MAWTEVAASNRSKYNLGTEVAASNWSKYNLELKLPYQIQPNKLLNWTYWMK